MSKEANDEPSQHQCTLSVHNDEYSEGTVVYDPETLKLTCGGLYLLAIRINTSAVQDFQLVSNSTDTSIKAKDTPTSSTKRTPGASKKSAKFSSHENHADFSKAMVFVAQPLLPNSDQKRKLRGMQVRR